MSLATDARNALSSYMATKRALCEWDRGPHDMAPQVDVRIAGVSHLAVIPDRDGIVDAVRYLESAGHAERVIFLADGYRKDGPADDPDAPRQRGDVTAAFHAGDLSVVEFLGVHAIDCTTGESAIMYADYKFSDEGLPSFGPVVVDQGTASGAVLDELRRLVR